MGCLKWEVQGIKTILGKGLVSIFRAYASPKSDGTRCPEM